MRNMAAMKTCHKLYEIIHNWLTDVGYISFIKEFGDSLSCSNVTVGGFSRQW